MRLSVLREVTALAFREFLRTPEAVFWTYGFPLVMALVLGLAFQRGDAPTVRVALAVDASNAAELAVALEAHADGRLDVEVAPPADAELGLARGRFDAIVLDVAGADGLPTVRFDPARLEGQLARAVVAEAMRRVRDGPRSAASDAVASFEALTERGSRYIDFLVPGLIGLNLLGAGMYGVGYNLVHMRVRQLLRRLAVTPLSRLEFLLSFVASRLVLVVPESLAITLFGVLAFDVPVTGSVLALFALVVAGALAFSGLGVLVAARPTTIESISGLMNLVMVPMWLFGGIFFSGERFPEWLQPFVRVLPLTQLNDGIRDVMLGGADLAAVALPLVYLLAFAAACFVLAARMFRWT